MCKNTLFSHHRTVDLFVNVRSTSRGAQRCGKQRRIIIMRARLIPLARPTKRAPSNLIGKSVAIILFVLHIFHRRFSRTTLVTSNFLRRPFSESAFAAVRPLCKRIYVYCFFFLKRRSSPFMAGLARPVYVLIRGG